MKKAKLTIWEAFYPKMDQNGHLIILEVDQKLLYILGKATDCLFHVYALTWKFSQKFQVDQEADFLSVTILYWEVPFG